MEESATVPNMKNLKTFIGIFVCAYLEVIVAKQEVVHLNFSD